MINVYGKKGFTKLINKFEKEGELSPKELEEMIRDSIREVLEIVFGKQIAPVLEDSLKIYELQDDEEFDPKIFMEKLDMLFGNDAKSIMMMIEGRMITKYHHLEFMRNLGLPIIH